MSGPICLKCDRPLEKLDENYIEDRHCSDCLRWIKKGKGAVLIQNRSFYEFNAFMKGVFALYKFRGDVEAGRVFSHMFNKEIARSYHHVDRVIPIPLSEERLYERGFNQCSVWIEGFGYEQGDFHRIKHEEK
ncbi:hypothetical protein ABFG93_14755 [Pseudalkalibacillus hwajinpoensis]|uniref:ComF family protein n=1 Tax=Guptibacillus hwajinpoensis TaxID=208199 RepID=UPI00325AC611